MKVLVLERGQFFTHEERLKHQNNKPFGLRYTDEIEKQGQTYLTNNHNKPWNFVTAFGGSSNCWTGCTPRFMPNDFKLKTMYNQGRDWPITYTDLEPFYCEAEAIMSISGPSETPYPMSKPYPLPPHQLSTIDKLIQKKYGSLYISQPSARASRKVGERNACCGSAVCNLCPVNSKLTIANTLKNIYHDPRVKISYQSQVVGLDCMNDYAKNIQFVKDNKTVSVEADLIALGANPIFNSHILLNSGDANGFTGRGICEQIGYYANFYLDGLENLGGGSIISANGFMLYDGEHRKDYAACIIENINDPFIRNEFGRWRQIAKFKFVFEDLPQDENRVLLSDNELLPTIEYATHAPYADRAYKALKKNINLLFDFLPIEKILLDEFPQLSEAHILSATRMGDSPKNSVVDKNLIHHQYRNVFVLGGGAFPTIAASNPTLTIAALSLMAADNTF